LRIFPAKTPAFTFRYERVIAQVIVENRVEGFSLIELLLVIAMFAISVVLAAAVLLGGKFQFSGPTRGVCF
jgi:prepilin-type N-terminal cleavage/methylation domain-containing protein